MTSAKEVIDTEGKYYWPVFARYQVVLERGEGPYVYDIEGKKYLDFLGGIAVNILGHAHPKLVAAISAQAAKLIHVSQPLLHRRGRPSWPRRWRSLQASTGLVLSATAAPSQRGALKLARKYGKTVAARQGGESSPPEHSHSTAERWQR
jgi:acetylornithine/N-succinyldiaminopimelate aminotransferase